MQLNKKSRKFLSQQRMTGPKLQVLRIAKQLKEADLETIASTMGVSIDYVKDICQELVQYNFLRQGPNGEYMVTRGSSKIQTSCSQNRIQQVRNIKSQAGSAITNRPGLSGKEEIEKDMDGNAKKYSIGEVIGEIKMSIDLPSPEQVESALRSNPQSSYKEMEGRLTSHTLICPAKGKEVPWHYCSACPHQKVIDLQKWIVQCSYEFNERRLSMVYGVEEIKALAKGDNGDFTDLDLEEYTALPHVKCPLLDKVIAVDRCTDCRYHRGGEWHYKSKKKGVVGWVLCGAQPFIDRRNDDSRTIKYGGKDWRAVPPRWR